MRMWMVDPSVLCRQHLLGEHNEIHKHRHNFEKGHRISGRIEINAVEPLSMEARHNSLAKEMEARGYNHKSPYKQPSMDSYSKSDKEAQVDVEKAMELLIGRCKSCRARAATQEA
jgi:hypothetical protein